MSNKIKVVILIFLLSSFLSVSYGQDTTKTDDADIVTGTIRAAQTAGDNKGEGKQKTGSGQSTSKTGKEKTSKGSGKAEDCSMRVGDEKFKCANEKQALEQKCDK